MAEPTFEPRSFSCPATYCNHSTAEVDTLGDCSCRIFLVGYRKGIRPEENIASKEHLWEIREVTQPMPSKIAKNNDIYHVERKGKIVNIPRVLLSPSQT